MLPTLGRLIAHGDRRGLRSTVPPITPVAWTSFVTGADPGVHGVFGFETLDPTRYASTPTSGSARRVPTLFAGLDAAAIRTATISVPWTYPPEPLRLGVNVPGWDAPSTGFDGTHPRSMASFLAA